MFVYELLLSGKIPEYTFPLRIDVVEDTCLTKDLRMRCLAKSHDSTNLSDETIIKGYCFEREGDLLFEAYQEFYLGEVLFSCNLPNGVKIKKLKLQKVVNPWESPHEYVISEVREYT